MEITVLGAGCARCDKTKKLIRQVAEELGMTVEILEVRDLLEIAKYDVPGVPAVIMAGKVLSSGKVPNRNEIRSWLTGG